MGPLSTLTIMAPPWLEPRTAYVHVPFCQHHCGYCDFAVTAGQDHLIALYLDALEQELAALGQPQPMESLFIGGGTPTYLNPDQLRRLLRSLNHWLPLRGERPEFSIESTPESLTLEKAALLASHGVNRISIGVQSFRRETLSALDRIHSPDAIPQAVEMVRTAGHAVSLDLIFAAPGATLESWAADLETALAFTPEHLSTYGLTYEKGTPLWKERERGAVRPVVEDAELAMYQHAIARLTSAGYEHYEVSNFARAGYRCRHNERYWANEAYHGFGVGAARYVEGRRELNVRDTKLYIRRVLAGESPTFQSESLPPRERAFETIAVQLRRMEGVNREHFRDQTGFALDDLAGPVLQGLVEVNLLEDSASAIRLTPAGKCVADGIIETVMKHL